MDEMWIHESDAEKFIHSTTALDFADINDENHTGWTVQAAKFWEHSRWSVEFQLVIRDHRGQFWGAVYSDPATEKQERDLWYCAQTKENDNGRWVRFEPMLANVVKVTEYVPRGA